MSTLFKKFSLWDWIFLPVFFYAACFILLTFPLILKFFSHFFSGTGDGLSGIWGLWLVFKSVTQHQSFWFTHFIQYPHGVTLVGHGLAPWKGLLGALLMPFASIKVTYNFMIIFSFVASGVTCFWLAYDLSRHKVASLAAGFIYTFASYHFIHVAAGHMHIMSQEWFPVFVLCWIRLIHEPSFLWSILSAFSLWMNFLCAQYYLMYAVMFGGVYFLWQTIRRFDLRYLLRKQMPWVIVFVSVSVALMVPVISPLLKLQSANSLIGIHSAEEYSGDVLALVIPGAWWRYAQWTESFWHSFTGHIYENGINLGFSIWVLLILVLIQRKNIQLKYGISVWFGIFVLFTLLSLGPVLQIGGVKYDSVPMLYPWVERLIPPLKMSGLPVRMIIVGILAASILSAAAIKYILGQKSQGRWIAGLILSLLLFEYLPGRLPVMNLETPGYVKALKNLPSQSAFGVMDRAAVKGRSTMYLDLYYQTIHHHPLAFGTLARIPTDPAKKSNVLEKFYQEGRFQVLCTDFGIRYLVLPPGQDSKGNAQIYQGKDATILDLGVAQPCRYLPESYEKI